VALTGQMNERPQRFEFTGLHFPLFTTDSEALPKLWATERINSLLSRIRVSGEQPELKQEVIDLARKFNLVTPYTSMYVPSTAEAEREKTQESAASEASKPRFRLAGVGGLQTGPQTSESVNVSASVEPIVAIPNSIVISGANANDHIAASLPLNGRIYTKN